MNMDKLEKIQKELKAPKGQYNSFGNYKYRSCEDILNAVKPMLDGCRITISDKIVQVGERYYIEATATFIEGDKKESVTAYAREDLTKKKMDVAQITGAASSYARKYALGGLLLIDDGQDSDSMNKHGKEQSQPAKKAYPENNNPWFNDNNLDVAVPQIQEWRKEGKDDNTILSLIRKKYKVSKEMAEKIKHIK